MCREGVRAEARVVSVTFRTILAPSYVQSYSSRVFSFVKRRSRGALIFLRRELGEWGMILSYDILCYTMLCYTILHCTVLNDTTTYYLLPTSY